jgi:UDP-N-acetylmuramoyl-L-alanyl-D-glutamate--2,6-diaminopimelate ligase
MVWLGKRLENIFDIMKKIIRKFINNQNPLLLFYHKVKAVLALLRYGNSSKKMVVIGVTGTDGKTTTVNLIADMLKRSGKKVGLISTLRYGIGDNVWSNTDKMTTNSPFKLQRMLRDMKKSGCEYVVMEVSSHAVVQSRVWGVNFDVGVFTNLTADHIEYHGSHEAYMAAKGGFVESIFSMRRKNIGGRQIQKVLVLNSDDKYFDYFNSFEGDQKITYGLQSGQLKALNMKLNPNGADFSLKLPNGLIDVKTNLLGDYNVANVLAAMGVGIGLNFDPEELALNFKDILPVPGRLEPINMGQDFYVVVDYAHTQYSLEKVCKIFKNLGEGRLILVFGATGGGRDKKKRPLMGKVADHYADVIVLTNDDPYHEDQEEIIEDIAKGIDREEGDNFAKIVDRSTAVEYGLSKAGKGDVVLITGKGGEEVIVIGDEKLPYDDRVVVRNYLVDKVFGDLNIADE